MAYIKLGDLCNNSKGLITITPDEVIDYVDISSVDNTGKCITGYESIRFADAPSRARRQAEKGDIIVSTVRPNLNAVAMCDFDAPHRLVVSTGFCVLSCKADVVPDYIFLFCQSSKFVETLVKQATGASYPAVNEAIIRNVMLPVHSYTEQTEIASRLKAIRQIISARQRQLHTLDTLIKARFVEMFEHEGHPDVSFGDICAFLRNGASIKQEKGAGGYPITRIETLSNDVFNIDRLGYAGITELGKYQGYLLMPGDILISHINSVAYLGRAVQYRGELKTPIIHGMNLLCARIIDSFDPTYIEFFFRTPLAKEYIATITKKAVNQASITTSDLKKMKVPSPPLEEQKAFATFVSQVDKSKVVVQAALDKAQNLFDSLMQQYFG